jgi:hypothetical protein
MEGSVLSFLKAEWKVRDTYYILNIYSIPSPAVSPSKRGTSRAARKRKRKDDFDYSDGQIHRKSTSIRKYE